MERHRTELLAAMLVAVLACAIITGGCGTGGGGDLSDASSPDQETTQPSVGATVTLYFVKGESYEPVSREVEKAGPERALEELLKGPGEEEKQLGVNTAIPEGTRLESFSVRDGTALADFSAELKDFGGGSAMVQAITRQISETVKSNDPSIEDVQITVEGIDAEEVLQP